MVSSILRDSSDSLNLLIVFESFHEAVQPIEGLGGLLADVGAVPVLQAAGEFIGSSVVSAIATMPRVTS